MPGYADLLCGFGEAPVMPEPGLRFQVREVRMLRDLLARALDGV